jgi:2-polyprenyl-3-methyl-5-hydroxy-6-metoxy-1,4-benzoquinol methylase
VAERPNARVCKTLKPPVQIRPRPYINIIIGTVMNEIITNLEKNTELQIELVYEFFNGKYSKDDVKKYLFEYARKSVRHGVQKLSDEFNTIENKNTDTIKQWYTETDFYIFDLLPYNAGPMYLEKVNEVQSLIKKYNFKSVLDFGAGLGIGSMSWAKYTDATIYYVDLKDSITSKFAKFLMDKLNITNVVVMNDEEFFNSDLRVDLITALDCFEHIPNMEETFDKLIEHTNVIFHDSTFYSDDIFPQHVYTPPVMEFINMCALRNFLPKTNMKLLWRAYLQFDTNQNLQINFI